MAAIDTIPSSEPAVSVILLTYNHGLYIEQAVRSILNQHAPWPLEIIVGEDCSIDETAEILRRIDAEQPGRLSLILREKNIGLSRNLEDCWRRCRGRYIFLLEGDDYWSDDHKLEKVVRVLDAQPECSGCFHACEVFSTIGNTMEKSVRPDRPLMRSVSLEDMFEGNPVQTYSVVTYRRGLVPVFPDWHRPLACGDWGLHMLHAEHGPLAFLPDVMTVYRLRRDGMMSSLPTARRWQEFFTLWCEMDRHFQGRCSAEITAARNHFIERLAIEFHDLKRIERRYHSLHLDHIAAAVRWLKLWRRAGSLNR